MHTVQTRPGDLTGDGEGILETAGLPLLSEESNLVRRDILNYIITKAFNNHISL
jgi:hypothetical protein